MATDYFDSPACQLRELDLMVGRFIEQGRDGRYEAIASTVCARSNYRGKYVKGESPKT